MARPTKYTAKLAADICVRLTMGDSLRKICEAAKMPAKSTILLWLFDGDHDEFSDQYARARVAQAELFADDIIEIADDVDPDTAEIAKARLRIDVRKWNASKMVPRYADKRHHVHEGGDEDKPIHVEWDDRALARRIALFLHMNDPKNKK